MKRFNQESITKLVTDLMKVSTLRLQPTQLQDGATLRRYGGGCSQADANKNDKQTLVGDVICIKDTTVVTSPIGTLDDSNIAVDSIVDSALIQ